MKHHRHNKTVVASFKKVRIFKLRTWGLTSWQLKVMLSNYCWTPLSYWFGTHEKLFIVFPDSQFQKGITWILMYGMNHAVNFWNLLWHTNINMSTLESMFLSVFNFKRKWWNWNEIMFNSIPGNLESDTNPREILKLLAIWATFGSLLFKEGTRRKIRTISSAN